MAVTNDGSGSSERVAAEFMSQGRPAAGQVVGNDISSSLPINPQVPGSDFKTWALGGYKLGGDIKTEGSADQEVRVPVVNRRSANTGK
jgi:hypothetical protein